jgi:hypothetical protein
MNALKMKGIGGGQDYLDSLSDTRMYEWQWKIRQMLDPNDVGERGLYSMVKPKG